MYKYTNTPENLPHAIYMYQNTSRINKLLLEAKCNKIYSMYNLNNYLEKYSVHVLHDLVIAYAICYEERGDTPPQRSSRDI